MVCFTLYLVPKNNKNENCDIFKNINFLTIPRHLSQFLRHLAYFWDISWHLGGIRGCSWLCSWFIWPEICPLYYFSLKFCPPWPKYKICLKQHYIVYEYKADLAFYRWNVVPLTFCTLIVPPLHFRVGIFEDHPFLGSKFSGTPPLTKK